MNMQLNRLEQFIFNHKDAFDTATPGDHVWTTIAQTLDAGQRTDGLEAFIQRHREDFDTAMPKRNLWTGIEQGIDIPQQPNTLERFVAENREAFDTATPSFRVWSEIDKVLHRQQTQRKLSVAPIWRVVRVAASVLILLSVGAMAGIYFTQSKVAATQTIASLSDISPEYAEMVQYYNEQIDEKVRQVSMETNDKSVLSDLEAIDKTMKELEAELQKAPKGAEEQIISNLIRSYQIKVEILERVLNRIQQSKENSNSEDDEISI